MAAKKKTKTRKKLKDEEPEQKSTYFKGDEDEALIPKTFIPTGCTGLDCILGGGWGYGTISNIIGDSSSGKTLLAIEATANYALQYSDAKIVYAESEAAFDQQYAKGLGMPIDRVEFREDDNDIHTVEDFYDDLMDSCDEVDKQKSSGLYILDSLDALSDVAEMDRDMSEGTYGTSKARQMSTLFRKATKRLKKSNLTLIVVSQTRQNIGVTFGNKWSVSGGEALKFYASQRVLLAHLKRLTKTVNKIKRATGVQIKAQCIKSKVGNPFREFEFPIIFGYGIDDLKANLDWLDETGFLKEYGQGADKKAVIKWLDDMDDGDYLDESDKIAKFVHDQWWEIERQFMPTRRKYK